MSQRYLRPPDFVRVKTDDRFATASGSGGRWTAPGVKLETVLADDCLEVRVDAPHVGLRWLQLRWQDGFPAGTRFLGDAWERSYGELEWRGYVPDRGLPWYFLAHNAGATSGLGVRAQAGAMACWMTDPRGVTLWLDCRCGGEGVKLGARTLEAATVVVHSPHGGESPFDAARHLCRKMCGRPRLPAQPVYGGNNWYHAYGVTSQKDVLAEADRVARWAPSGGNRPFMVIDAGWQPARTRGYLGGPWHTGNEHFPDVPGLIAAIRDRGVRPAIWFRPLLTAEACPSDWLLAAVRPHGWVDHGHFLDPTVPAVRDRIAQDLHRFIGEWGCELVKHDFSAYDMLGFWGSGLGGQYVADGWAFADRTRTTAEIIVDFYRHLRTSAGETPLLGCNTVGHLCAGLFEIQRIGDDSSSMVWSRTRRINVNALAFRLPQNGIFFGTDADCVPLSPRIPWQYSRQWLELLSLSGTPLFVSAAPDTPVGPEQEEAVRLAFARAAAPQPPIEPLDWLDHTTPERWRINGEVRQFDWTANEGSPPPPSWPYSDIPPAVPANRKRHSNP